MTRTPPLYALARHTIGRAVRALWRPTVTGREHLPPHTGAILAANHLSVADQLFLAAVTGRHIAFWAKTEYFRTPGPRGRLTRRIVTGLGAIPVERAGGRAVLSAFDAALPILRAGGLVVVFPEGTRSPDGRLYRGRTGAVRLAHRAGVPIIPVGIRGTGRPARLADGLPGRRAIGISFAAAVTVRLDGPADARRHTDDLMAAIRSLSGQEYVPTYAPTRLAPRPRSSPRTQHRAPAKPTAGWPSAPTQAPGDSTEPQLTGWLAEPTQAPGVSTQRQPEPTGWASVLPQAAGVGTERQPGARTGPRRRCGGGRWPRRSPAATWRPSSSPTRPR